MYVTEVTPAFVRNYQKLPVDVQRQVDKQVQRLCQDPHHPSLHTHKRRGEDERWQARITRNYRLYFTMKGNVIYLEGVGPHEK